MFAVEIENLTKIYDQKTVVDNLNLAVKTGEIFTLLGANGSGKSTTVKMLTGLLKPTGGQAKILNFPISHDNIELKKKIGVLPENNALFDNLSIWEHIFLIGEIYGLSRDEAALRGEQLLKHLDLWEDRFTRIEQCSFGMKKKTSLALALIHNPQVVFLDEPFEGIDPTSSRNIKDVILFAAGKNCTFFITSHSLEIMEQIIDSFAIISRGKIVYQADLKIVKAENKNLEAIYFEYVKNDMRGEIGWLGQ
jgi:ABC-2 type transport system ATP-binding protein